MGRITIVEPHGDDALISFSSVLGSWDEVRVVTLFDDRPSELLTQFYPNVEVVSLMFDRFRGTQYSDRPKASDFSSEIERGLPAWETWRDKVLADNPVLFDDIVTALTPYMEDTTVGTVVGCIHAQHIMTREALLKIRNGKGVVLASEPAIRYRRVGTIAEREAVKALGKVSFKSAKSDPNKLKVFKKVYNTETYLIRSRTLEDDFMEREVFWRC